ncbi:hypothetical protein VTI28DRAFT_6318 [Corynascus sepedonium]
MAVREMGVRRKRRSPLCSAFIVLRRVLIRSFPLAVCATKCTLRSNSGRISYPAVSLAGAEACFLQNSTNILCLEGLTQAVCDSTFSSSDIEKAATSNLIRLKITLEFESPTLVIFSYA